MKNILQKYAAAAFEFGNRNRDTLFTAAVGLGTLMTTRDPAFAAHMTLTAQAVRESARAGASMLNIPTTMIEEAWQKKRVGASLIGASAVLAADSALALGYGLSQPDVNTDTLLTVTVPTASMALLTYLTGRYGFNTRPQEALQLYRHDMWNPAAKRVRPQRPQPGISTRERGGPGFRG